MHYGKRINYKGLLATNADKTVDHPKQAYFAVQHVTAIFDDTLTRISSYPFYFAPWQQNQKRFSAFGYAGPSGRQVVAIWGHADPPDTNSRVEQLTLTLPAGRFQKPVWVDLLSGEVRAIPESQWEQASEQPGRYIFRDLPVYDSVILVADQSLVSTTTDPR